jgi:uncharacterized protein (DUF305 family)
VNHFVNTSESTDSGHSAMIILRVLLAALLTAVSISLAYGQATTSMLNSDTPELPSFSAPADTLNDRSFLALIVRNNLEALAITQAAHQRCQRPELQQMAQHFGEEQQLSLRKIREIASVYGIDLALAKDRQLARLAATMDVIADGEFDVAYLELMRANQMTALLILQAAGRNPAERRHAHAG